MDADSIQLLQAAHPRIRRAPRGLIFPAVVLVLLLVFGAWLLLDFLFRPRLVSGPMLQVADANGVNVTWSATVHGHPSRAGWLSWRRPDGLLTQRKAALNALGYYSSRIDFAADGGPAACEIANAGFFGRRVILRSGDTVRPPAKRGQKFRFLAFGDSGNGSETQASLVPAMQKAAPDLIIHTGDLIYPAGAAWDYAPNFFEPYAELLRTTPFMPSLGNHDYGTFRAFPYLATFSLPRNGPKGIDAERIYSFAFGDALFVALDSNHNEEKKKGVISRAQMRDIVAPWLRKTLAQPGYNWRLVFFHHPPYTGCPNHPEVAQLYMKDIFVPVFDDMKVSVVFCGHNHLYERTKPLRGGQIVPPGEGTVYVTTGAGGNTLYPEGDPRPVYIETHNDKLHSFTQVDVSADRLEIRQIGAKGEVIDSATLAPRR